jgi:hypothetical protein
LSIAVADPNAPQTMKYDSLFLDRSNALRDAAKLAQNAVKNTK